MPEGTETTASFAYGTQESDTIIENTVNNN